MDTAVGLVQAYLHLNGYFTVVEFPVLEAFGRSGRTITDLDMLAFRFPRAQTEFVGGRGGSGTPVTPDPVLQCRSDHPDMIVGEVKEGAAHFNEATRDPEVLSIALTRFGCCDAAHSIELANELVRHGHAITPAGHVVRMVAFGMPPDQGGVHRGTLVPMNHVVTFVRSYLRAHWNVLRHAQLKDQSLNMLALLEKWGQ